MNFESNYRELESQYIMPAFSREIMITKGSGCTVTDADGKQYLDLVAGIAVCSTGHCHPKVVKAIAEQAAELIHCSNLFYVPHQGALAKKLVEISGLPGNAKAFFSNSGAEAMEGALKLARIRTGRKEFIACEGGFHGRTMGSLACTHKPAIREPFMPLQPFTSFVPYGDVQALKGAITEETAAVILEPIQGEGGVIIPPPGYLKQVREICDAKGVLLIVDEVQSGMGRTGHWFAFQEEGIHPDIITMAKAMASGFPMGAIVAREGLEFGKSEHGSTFAGGPIACAAALASIDVIGKVLPEVAAKGERFRAALAHLNPRVKGLMIGITIGDHCADVQKECAVHGLLVNCAAHGNLRLVPPLTITNAEIDKATGIINAAVSKFASS
ncbi:acetylornithine transaminase [Methanospirillum lacunae]|uniref:Acetylornithine transaminase n=1 Tax=Methanospirillum lacunae TaxID=668570 RepID=A0A2V2MSZ3_9EURY|nr:acetylornithine transaminase [Methanospirillum lacunae]PWR70529.1 acetylornithine transaminase [Methanospirillum lacunae]